MQTLNIWIHKCVYYHDRTETVKIKDRSADEAAPSGKFTGTQKLKCISQQIVLICNRNKRLCESETNICIRLWVFTVKLQEKWNVEKNIEIKTEIKATKIFRWSFHTCSDFWENE